MEQHPHVWIQLPLDAPCIPGRRCEQENISAQQILWLHFLGPRCLDLPAWGDALQGIGQGIRYVLCVAAGRGKDDADDSALTDVRHSIGSIGGDGHELPPLSTGMSRLLLALPSTFDRNGCRSNLFIKSQNSSRRLETCAATWLLLRYPPTGAARSSAPQLRLSAEAEILVGVISTR